MSSFEGYNAIAGIYDRLNADIDYAAWADFFEACFDKFLKKRPEIILDLACGTGRMTRELAARKYDMIGVDGSEDMLSEAYSAGGEGILYLLQDMRSFELYGTVGAVVCCLDSINYLTEDGDLKKTFSLVHNYLDSDGLFIFDVNSPYKFECVYGDNSYILEGEHEDGRQIYCGWQNSFDKESGICDFYLSVFEENEDGSYFRADEHQCERCYQPSAIKTMLEECGFEFVGATADFDFTKPAPEDERIYFIARAKK